MDEADSDPGVGQFTPEGRTWLSFGPEGMKRRAEAECLRGIASIIGAVVVGTSQALRLDCPADPQKDYPDQSDLHWLSRPHPTLLRQKHLPAIDDFTFVSIRRPQYL